jgi:hypothetical protein
MTRRLTWSAEAPVSVEQVRSAYSDKEYWLARLAQFGAGTDVLDSLIIDADGTVTVATTMSVLGDRLPRVVNQFHRGDLKLVRHEKWAPVEGGRVRGQISTTGAAAPLHVLTEALLAPVRVGSRVEYTTTVDVRLPFLGGKIETHIGGKLPEEMAKMHRFTMAWIAGNA